MMKIFFIIMSLQFLSLKNKNYLMNNLIILIFFMLTLMMIFLNNFLNYYWNLIYYNFGFDNLSFSLVLLTFWISALSMISNNKLIKFKNLKFMQLMIILMMMMIYTFSSINMIIFYIFFEISLIPIILIIMGWGFQIDRIQASMYMMFYTLFGSLPLLIFIIFLFYNNYTLMFNILYFNNFLMNYNNLIFYLMLNLAFFIKMPMYFLHVWLPKAHVEAPISGSMILAGVMLKLGSYGIYRTMNIFLNMYLNYGKFMILINLMGSLIGSLICLNCSDMKIIIAYSSVVHMSLMLAGMMTLFNMSFKGSILMMVAHGLCSSGLFYISNLNYERIKSRNIFINKNMMNIFPSLTLWWFLICSSNFSAPFSLNLFSEIFLFNSLIQWNIFLILIIVLISFFSTCYSIFLYAFSQYGKMNFNMYNFNNINCKEYNMMILHWLPLNIIFIDMNIFIF
uniref:NADH-ubiquinone oxidoreductase chain 4 n=1 Tax=Habrobracon hebetor TaxID=69819 RepID=A0A7D5I072_9HYME|nr:NADH dehydrogenase subunit 4 [Habrobracon hebetor]